MTQQTGIRRELEAALEGAAGASLRQAIDWRSIKWKPANRNVRCLQRRIVEAQQLRLLYRVLRRGRLKCLSRVRRKQQARFLGEGDGSNAIPLPGKWKRANCNVRRLQRRIVQAQQQGKKRTVRALQFILTRSYSAHCLAVRRVVENPGRCTPGVDGQILDTPEKKAQAVEKLSAEDYQPQPLKRVYIAKKNGKGRRPLGIPTMDDRAHQALHLLALEPLAETTADPNSYGFRKERSVADAIEQCFILLSRSTSPQWILEGDIQSCFDHAC